MEMTEIKEGGRMIRILVADDEPLIRRAIREYAEFEGWEVAEASDGREAVELVMDPVKRFDAVVLDIMMPRLDGFSACKEIRRQKEIPVLLLSARGEEYDKLFGFEVGADDYVVKPFSGRELIARIKVMIGRKQERSTASDLQAFEGLEVDFKGRSVAVDGIPVNLTPKEYDLMFFLVRHPNTAFSREQLLSEVWGYDFYGDARTVDAHIKMLRAHLGKYRRHIVTLRGMGYKFDAQN